MLAAREVGRERGEARGQSAHPVGEGLAEEIVTTFLTTDFEGGRHARRVDQITQLESDF